MAESPKEAVLAEFHLCFLVKNNVDYPLWGGSNLMQMYGEFHFRLNSAVINPEPPNVQNKVLNVSVDHFFKNRALFGDEGQFEHFFFASTFFWEKIILNNLLQTGLFVSNMPGQHMNQQFSPPICSCFCLILLFCTIYA